MKYLHIIIFNYKLIINSTFICLYDLKIMAMAVAYHDDSQRTDFPKQVRDAVFWPIELIRYKLLD